MTSIKALLAGLGILAASSLAASGSRNSPADLGLSIWVPEGWGLFSEGGAADYRFYSLYDLTGAHQAYFQFQVNSGVYATEGSARQWTLTEGMVREFDIEGSCFGSVISSDTLQIDGSFAREVYGRSATCDSGSTTLLSNLQDRFYRMTALGDIGWVMAFEGDTADVDTAANTYLSILDSVKLNLNFNAIPYVGIRARQAQAARPKSLVVDGTGLRLNLGTETAPEIEVMDLQGRVVSGRTLAVGGGVWSWRPDRIQGGMVAIRVGSVGQRWTDRAVLPR